MVVLLAVPATVVTAAGGFVHAFHFSILLWPFNLVLPQLRHLPHVCATLPLVEKGPMVPVHLGHWSRLPNRDPLLGTNAGPGFSTNRDR
jgi:hypothetical protein